MSYRQKIERADRPIPKTDEEWLALVRSDREDIIRNDDDWARFIAEPGRRESLFPGCDDETVHAFSRGLVFHDGVIASADYSMLADKLTYRQVYRIWGEAFMLPEQLVPDHDGYACTSPHTCTSATMSICMSGC